MPQGARIDRGRLDSALDAIARAIRLKSELSGPFEMRASIKSCIGQWRGCDRDAAEAVRRGGAPIWALIRMGSTREAVEVARRNAALNPLDITALDHLGEALRLVGGYVEALPAVERSFTLNPSPDSAHDLALTLIATGAHDRARRLMDTHSGLVDAGLALHAPQTRQFLLSTMNAAPPPGAADIVERVTRGEGYFEQAALMLAQMGAVDLAGAMIDRMGMADLPNLWVLFDPRCRPLQGLPSFLGLIQRVGLFEFWRSGARPPQFCARASLPFPCRA